jgi:hypothetical protein
MPSFPQVPLPVVAGVAPGANPVDVASWNFTDVTTDFRESGAIGIQVGRGDENSLVGPTTVRATVDNRTGNYCRTNPLGTWFGQLDKGSPIQARIARIVDTFTRTGSSGFGTEPNSGLTWAHTSASSWSTNGTAGQCAFASVAVAAFATLAGAAADDVDVTHTVSLSAVATGAAWIDATVLRYSDANNQYRLHCELGTGGVVSVLITKVVATVLTNLTAVIPTSITYSAGTKIRVRTRAIGPTLQIRVWLDGNTEPATWDAEVDDDDLTGQSVGLYQWRLSGNTNAGTLTATFDDFRMDAIRATTPVPEWPVRWDQSGNDVTSPIAGAGILRRLGQGASALRSPMYRQISGLSTLRGYWPGEDGSDATGMSAAYPRTSTAKASDVSFAAADGPAGSDRLLTLGSAGFVQGVFPANIDTGGWQIQWTTNLAGADGTERQAFAWSTSNGYWWVWQASLTTYRIVVLDNTGATLLSSGTGNGGIAPGQDIVFRIKCSRAGSTWTVEPGWYREGDSFLTGFSDTFSGSAGRPGAWRAASNTVMQGAYLGHVFATTTTAESLQTLEMLSAINGYPGETAGNRLIRLSAQEAVPLRMFGDPDATVLMGAQRSATYLDLVRECEAADQGTLVETGAGLGYQTRAFRYNQPVALALDFDSGHVAAPPEPTDDDQRLRNRIVLRRADGGSVTAEDAASIAKSGIYSDEPTVNLASDDLLDPHAYWRLHLGTLDELRWPRISLQLHRNPSLIADWCKVRVGSRITIANPPGQVGAETLDLIVEGWTETLDTWTWDVELVCSPASAWQVGAYDGTSRYDLRTCTMTSAAAGGVTSLGFTITNDERWSTTSTPYGLLISGELVTVTSMGARTGTGPYTQTATVTRAVNGISKTLPAGAEVHIATPGRYAI